MIEWIERNTLVMNQHDFDTQISRIQSGTEIAISFKDIGLGPDQFSIFNHHAGKLKSDEQEKETVSDAVRVVTSQIELFLEFIYMEENLFMDDFRLAIVKSKIQDFNSTNNVSLFIITNG
jgi:hypothetical protein